MSFGITIFLSDKQVLTDDYFAFLDDCASILGQWSIQEATPLNPNSDEIIHDCALLPTGKHSDPEKQISVWISLERRNFTKKYGRSRRKISWAIYIETKAGRSFWDLAIQMLIPLKVFSRFGEVVVVVDPETVFLHPKNYESFVISEFVNAYGEDSLAKIGLGNSKGVAPNNGLQRTRR